MCSHYNALLIYNYGNSRQLAITYGGPLSTRDYFERREGANNTTTRSLQSKGGNNWCGGIGLNM